MTRGEPGLATALTPRMKLSLEPSPTGNTELVSGSRQSSLQDQPLSGYFALASQALLALRNYFDCPLGKKQKLEWVSEWKAEEGLGSSSAVIATLLQMGQMLSEHPKTRHALWLEGRRLVRSIQHLQASGLDLAAQLWGGSILVQSDHVEPVELKRPPQLVLVHTGQKSRTPEMLETCHLSSQNTAELGQSVKNFLENRDWREAIERHHAQLLQMNVVPRGVQAAEKHWRQKGWIDVLKTTGAGGGDALLVWATDPHSPDWQNDLRQRGWWVNSAAWNAPGSLEFPDDR